MLFNLLQAAVDTTALTQAMEPAVQEKTLSLIDMAQAGGWLMLVLLLLSVMAIYIFGSKWWMIRKAGQLDKNFMKDIRDLIHDGKVRMKELIQSLSTEAIDFVVFLGDLCRPYPEYHFLMDALHSLNIPLYCAIGNHDIEYSNKEAVTAFYGIPNDYYSFTYENTKFLIMSGNYIPYDISIQKYIGREKRCNQYPK